MTTNDRPTDASWLLDHLTARAGEWVPMLRILAASMAERGCGLTVHSRVAELRRRHGATIENRTRRTPDGRVLSEYRLVPTASVEVGEQASLLEVAS